MTSLGDLQLWEALMSRWWTRKGFLSKVKAVMLRSREIRISTIMCICPLEGNYKVASAFSEALLSQLGASESLPISREEMTYELAFTQWDEFRILQNITEHVLSKVPYTNQWNHREKQLIRRRQVKEREIQLTPKVSEKSLSLYQAALKKRPGNTDLRRRMSQLLVDRGELDNARRLLRSLVEDFPKNIEAQYQLSLIAVSMNYFDEAEKSLLDILS